MKGVSKNPITELVGPHQRRPLRGYTYNFLSKIYSFYPHHNPFPNLAHFSGNDLEAKNNKEASLEVLSEGVKFNGSEKLVNESSRTDQVETVVGFGSGKIEAVDRNVCNVIKHLSGLEEILKNGLQQPVTDDKVDSLSAWNSMDRNDVDGNSMPVENNESRELLNEGNIKDDFSGENNKMEVEVKSLSCIGDGNSCANACPESVVANVSDSVNVERNETNFSSEGTPQDASLVEGLTSSMRKEQEGGSISNAKSVDTKKKKKRKKESDDKGKSKKRKKDEPKDAKAGKSDSVVVKASNDAKSGDSHPMPVHGKVSKKNVRKEKSSTRKVDKSCPGSQHIIQYTQKQLLHLKQVAVPDNIMNAVHAISADLFKKNQKSASGDSTDARLVNERQPDKPPEDSKVEEKLLDAGDSSKGQKDISADKKEAEEMLKDSGIVKKRKRGTSSEARKEKKKQKRRQKRTELNKKLGVKRLKLRPPVLKPKEVQPCRHYLKGRCHEGEKCKFSHDVVPLTKSKPCCHFARQACLKGDDCPFDHQLAKYPCNNYVTTGYCIRGDACLFSHKVQDKDRLEQTVDVSKEVKFSDQFDKMKPKQHDTNLSTSSGVETLKETSKTKTSQPAQAPKGLSFVSFGKSLLHNSVKPKLPELDSSLQIHDRAVTGHKLNQTQSGTTVAPDNPLIQGSLTRGPNIVEMPRVSASPSTPKKISVPSFNEPACGNNEKRSSTTETDNLKATQADSGQCSGRLGGSAEIVSNRAQKALSSTLAFAAKYESGIKMSSAAASATKEVDNKNKGTSSVGGGVKNEATKASAILEFLFSSGNKQKQ